MIPTPLPISLEAFAPPSSRSSGIHFSDILKPILRRMDAKRFGGEFKLDQVYLGFVWEEVLSAGFTGLVQRSRAKSIEFSWQNEISAEMGRGKYRREVFFTPDCVDLVDLVLCEFKCTWMSARHKLSSHKFWHWMVQVKAYLRVLGLTRARIYVLFVDGDYNPRRRIPKAWEVEFTRREIEENWSMLEREMEALIEEGVLS